MANQNDPYAQQLYNQTGGQGFLQRDQEGGFDMFGQVGDIFQGSVNGAEEALRSTFGLINYINPLSRQEGDMVEFDFIDDPDTGLGALQFLNNLPSGASRTLTPGCRGATAELTSLQKTRNPTNCLLHITRRGGALRPAAGGVS